MRRSLALGALLMLGLCSSRVARAAARELELSLVYRVPPGCPAADVFLAGLNRHVAFGGSNYLKGAIVVTPIAQGGFQLWMQFNGSRIEELRGDDCEQLVALATRVAGMARTESPAEKAEAQLEKAIEVAPDPLDWVEAQAPFDPDRGSEASPLEPSTARVDADRTRPLEDSHQPIPRRDGPWHLGAWRPSVLVHGQWVNGALPRPGLGWGATLEAAHERWRVRLEATAWPEQTWTFFPGPRPEQVTMSQQALALGLCHDLTGADVGFGRVSSVGCARGGVVWLESSASDSNEVGRGTTRYAVGGARVGLEWQHAGLRVGLLGGLDVVSGQRRILPGGNGNERVNEFVLRSVQPAFSLAIGWQFGAAPATRHELSVEEVAHAD